LAIVRQPSGKHVPKPGKTLVSAQTEIFQRLVRDLMRPPPVRVAPGTSVGEVVNRMTETASSAAVVVDAGSRPRGIVTEQDVVRRIAWRVEPDQAVEAVMTTPVVVVGADDYLFEAVALMRRRKFRHVPVVDGDGAVIGMLGLEAALDFLSSENLALIDQLTHEESIEGLKRVKLAQVELVSALLQKNVPVPEVQALLTEINNDIHRRALRQLEAAMREDGWGEPPSRFSVIIMGSGGRGENFLAPDQDNGFVIADDEDSGQGRRKDAYFLELAERMAGMLDAVGFRRCIGNVMATNPVWRKTLSQWRRQIDTWISRCEPEMLMNCGIFFDFRHGFGDPELSAQLRAHITEVIPKFPQFLRRVFAVESDRGNVALGWLGGLRKESHGDERRGVVNLKLRGTLPLVEGARLLALEAGIPSTSTLARLAALRDLGALNAADHDDLADAFRHLTHLLLRQQIEDFRAGREVGNYVPEERLSRREKKYLLASFRAIENLRATLRMEFSSGSL
jgi:signal-transduction protein with cAMP-binding, CBS, and nucleotidyltransferase domain